MKVIQLYKNESQLIKKALRNDREAQHRLYSMYSPKMLSVCRQYINDIHYAEDVMVSAFLKVFTKIGSFKNEGSFEGWIRKIMIRECISFLRGKNVFGYAEEINEDQYTTESDIDIAIGVDEIQSLIDALPEGYRVVFVMYAIEGYKHHEIAEMLQISEGTSKSQLFKARKMLKENLLKLNTRKNGTK
ncbi:sigma-70 family RNA polymerase sigma factor [Leptobacterium flavescens]|uniref:Sigma-70 family RNA polymerase sigma factor n=1 Tax=Leptobacterium flavescens TaxID=472055 RepID=A0A6P0UHL7_9FLAO|nr:RNA polymerase sigma factor [Leptobacterium flavescens]NER12497.1 sigma-70 family RNA polymerase sigma factor [Leptobacterium flavescens]